MKGMDEKKRFFFHEKENCVVEFGVSLKLLLKYCNLTVF